MMRAMFPRVLCAILISAGVSFVFFFPENVLHGQIHWEMLHSMVPSRKFPTCVRIVKTVRNLMIKVFV